MSSSIDLYSPKNILGFIPVGGQAKRLRPVTDGTSKAVVRFLNKPLIENLILGSAAEVGIRDFIFGVQQHKNYTDIYDRYGSGICFSVYGIPDLSFKYQVLPDVGSADSLRKNLNYYEIGNRPVFVAQSDNIFDVPYDLPEMIKQHRDKNAFMTIALVRIDNVEGCGVANFDNEKRITHFVEKPEGEPPSYFVNAGIYLFAPEIKDVLNSMGVEEIINKGRLDFGKDLIPYLVRKGFSVYGYFLQKFWHDVGTIPRYLAAMHDMLGRENVHRRPGKEIFPGVFVGGISDKSAKVRGTIEKKFESGKITFEPPVIIGKHCQISDGVRISRSCIDDYTHIGNGSVIEDSAVMDRAVIGEEAEIKYSIIGRCAKINSTKEKQTKISSFSAIGNNATVEAGCESVSSIVKPEGTMLAGEHLNENPYTD